MSHATFKTCPKCNKTNPTFCSECGTNCKHAKINYVTCDDCKLWESMKCKEKV